jgi:ribonuclease HI
MDERKSVSTMSSGDRKRKRSTPSYYVVKAGHNPGIYYNWADVQEQIRGYKSPDREHFHIE